MVKTRQKSDYYFNALDLEILEKLNVRNGKKIGYSVLELAKKLNVSHLNLKIHLAKLDALDLVHPILDEEGKHFLLTTKKAYSHTKELKEFFKEEIAREEVLLNYLKATKDLTSKDLKVDYRKEKKKLTQQIKEDYINN